MNRRSKCSQHKRNSYCSPLKKINKEVNIKETFPAENFLITYQNLNESTLRTNTLLGFNILESKTTEKPKNKDEIMHKQLKDLQKKINMLEGKIISPPNYFKNDNYPNSSRISSTGNLENELYKNKLFKYSSKRQFTNNRKSVVTNDNYNILNEKENGSQEIFVKDSYDPSDSNDEIVKKLKQNLEYERKQNFKLKNIIKTLNEELDLFKTKYQTVKTDFEELKENYEISEQLRNQQRDLISNLKEASRDKYSNSIRSPKLIIHCKGKDSLNHKCKKVIHLK